MIFRDPCKKITADAVALRAYIDALQAFRNTTYKVGFLSGFFDLMHPGHMVLFNEARAHCDFLVVAIASDEQAKRKGPERPIMPRHLRALAVANMATVDAVIVAPPAIDKVTGQYVTDPAGYLPLRADVAFFGSDCSPETIAPHRLNYGREIKFVGRDLGCHTSQIIARAQKPAV